VIVSDKAFVGLLRGTRNKDGDPHVNRVRRRRREAVVHGVPVGNRDRLHEDRRDERSRFRRCLYRGRIPRGIAASDLPVGDSVRQIAERAHNEAESGVRDDVVSLADHFRTAIEKMRDVDETPLDGEGRFHNSVRFGVRHNRLFVSLLKSPVMSQLSPRTSASGGRQSPMHPDSSL